MREMVSRRNVKRDWRYGVRGRKVFRVVGWG
jgi:hypothetical protein